MSRTLEYDVYTHFRGESFLQVRHPIQWRIALQGGRNKRSLRSATVIAATTSRPRRARSSPAKGRSFVDFGVFRKRVAQRFEFLLQTVEGLQRNDQFPIRPAAPITSSVTRPEISSKRNTSSSRSAANTERNAPISSANSNSHNRLPLPLPSGLPVGHIQPPMIWLIF